MKLGWRRAAISVVFALTGSAALGAAQSVYNSYWSTAAGFQATAELHNNLVSQSLVVTPIFYDASGWSVQLPAINLLPLGNSRIDINARLTAQGWTTPRTGTAIFLYQGKWPGALTVEVYMQNTEESVSFTIPSAEKLMSSTMQNAVFWLPSPNAEVYVALQNTSNVSVSVFPNVTVGGQRLTQAQVQLPPYGSSVLEVSKGAVGSAAGGVWQTNAVGGISLVLDGPSGALNASGWIEEDGLGYSTTMTFQDPTASNGRLASTQILIGDVTEALSLDSPLIVSSRLVAYNVGGQPVSFQGELVFAQNGDLLEAPIQPTALGPGEVKWIDLDIVKSEAGVPLRFSVASIALQYSGMPGR